jgi:predicted deacylase
MNFLTDLTRQDLFSLYQRIADAQASGIPGVLSLSTAKPGPQVGIMACTHGNEPAGLAAFAYLLKHLEHLQCGTVHLIVNNLAAASRYFEQATDLTFTAHYRFVDRDMNRVHAQWQQDNTAETERVLALLPLFKTLDVVFDLHSTSAPSDPMLVLLAEDPQRLAIPGVNIVLQNLIPHLNAPPLVSLCEKAEAFVLETGSHEDPRALIIAQAAVQALLVNMGLLPEGRGNTQDQQTHELTRTLLHDSETATYEIYQAIVFPHESYSLLTLIPNLGFLPRGTILAQSEEGLPDIVVDRDAYAVMPPPRLKPVHPGSEFLYLAQKLSV